MIIQRELKPMTPENAIYREIPENSWTDVPLPDPPPHNVVLDFITSLGDPVGTRYRIIREVCTYVIIRQPKEPSRAEWE